MTDLKDTHRSLAAGERAPAVRALRWATLAGLAAVVVATPFAAGGGPLFETWIYHAVSLAAAGLCLLRAALVVDHRRAWILFGLAILSWTVGDLIWTVLYRGDADAVTPSAADLFFLLFYPLALAGIVSLGGSRVVGRSWLDGLIGALGAAALLAVVAVAPAAGGGGDTATVVTDFAYPVGDMFLLAALFSITLVAGEAAGRSWALLAAGIAMFVIADATYLIAVDAGSYEVGGWIDPFWLAGLVLIAFASWSRAGGSSRLRRRGAPAVALPAILALSAIALLIADHYHRLPGSAVLLAGLTLVAASVRFGLIRIENRRLVGRMAASLHRYRTLIDTAGEAVVTFDAKGVYTFVNDRFSEITGYERDDVIGHSVLEFVPAGGERAGFADRLAAGEADGPVRIEMEASRKGGSPLWLLVNASPMLAGEDESDEGGQPGYVAMFSDISDRHRAELALRESERRFRVSFENAPIGMALSSFEPGGLGHYLRVNRRYCELVGYTEQELLALDPALVLHPDDQAAELELLGELTSGKRSSYELEKRLVTASGEPIEVLGACSLARDEEGRPLYAIRHVEDIGARKQFERELRELATHDPMTGLVNRRRLDEELDRELAFARRYDEQGAVLMLDLDGFKRINDCYGHEAGDEALIAITAALSARLRRTDAFARVGGDEFVIVLPRTEPAGAERFAKNLLETVRGVELRAGDGSEHLTASVGIATYSKEAPKDVVELLAQADEAMYAAKRAGRNRFELYSRAEAAAS